MVDADYGFILKLCVLFCLVYPRLDYVFWQHKLTSTSPNGRVHCIIWDACYHDNIFSSLFTRFLSWCENRVTCMPCHFIFVKWWRHLQAESCTCTRSQLQMMTSDSRAPKQHNWLIQLTSGGCNILTNLYYNKDQFHFEVERNWLLSWLTSLIWLVF